MDKSVSDLLRRLAEKDKEIERLSKRPSYQTFTSMRDKIYEAEAVIQTCKEALELYASYDDPGSACAEKALSVIGELEC